jgi:hypothetical protein
MGDHSDPGIWDRLDHQLVSLKLSLIADEFQNAIAADIARIRFEQRQNLNALAVPHLCLKIQEERTDDWAARAYHAYCEVWAIQGERRSGSFLRTVHARGLTDLFAARGAAVIAQLESENKWTKHFSPEQIKAWQRSCAQTMERLSVQWRAKIEIEAKTRDHVELPEEGEWLRTPNHMEVQNGESIQNPQSPAKSTPKSRSEKRDAKIFAAIQYDRTGVAYCLFVDALRLMIPAQWREAGCPSRYAEAYLRMPWRRKINAEKFRAHKRYKATSPQQCVSLIDKSRPAS